MNVSVNGKGEYTLELENGNLKVSLAGQVLYVTKGNPSVKGNPPFADLDACLAYFNTTTEAQPMGLSAEELAGEGV